MKKFLVFWGMALLIMSCRTEPSSEQSSTVQSIPSSLNLRLSSEPDALSPILARNTQARKVCRHLYTRLLQPDPESLEFVPYLAENSPKIETLENGNQMYTFDIHPNAAWSDGTSLSVQDVLFSYKMLLHPGVSTRYKIIADVIFNIEVDKEKGNRIHFIADECHITLASTIGEMFIYPEHIFDPEKTLRQTPYIDFKDSDKISELIQKDDKAGEVAERFMDPEYVRDPAKFVTSGAYTFNEWTTGQRIKIQKNENWWAQNLEGNVFTQGADEIVFQIIPDNTTALTQLINGELDAISDLPAENFDEYKNRKNLSPQVQTALVTIWLTLNNKKGLLSDKNVRKALAYVCDEKAIIENAVNGYGQLITGPFIPGSKDYNAGIPPTAYQPEKAEALLKESGWSDSNNDGILDKVVNGKRTNLSLEFVMTPTSTLGPIVGELLKNGAKKVGFDIRLTPKEAKVYRAEQKAGNFDIVFEGSGVPPGLYDPKGRWHTESFPPNGNNYSRFGNEKSDKIIDKIRVQCDSPEERIKLSHQLHAMIAEEQPVIFLYFRQSLHLINNKYDNIVVSANYPGLYEEFLTLK